MKNNVKIRTVMMLAIFLCSTIVSSGQGLKGDKGTKSSSKSSAKSKSQSSTFSSDYNWGIGVRLGDPSGFTFKKYMGSNALELSVGRAHVIGRRGYWNTHYQSKWNTKYYNSSYKKIDYLGYTSSSPLGVQLHYLWQKNIASAEGLSWYYGLGGQFAFQSIRYQYRYQLTGTDTWIYDNSGTSVDIDFGADGVVGLEYGFSNVPISIFLDFTLFMEVYDNPFVFWYQSGIGARYNF